MKINQATAQFIALHRTDDVARLALKGCKDTDVDMAFALRQIEGWQAARHKLPTWAATDGVVFPPKVPMEQCSSDQTARHKAAIVERLIAEGGVGHQRMVDLTGGFGIDFSFISRGFIEKTYVERQKELCLMAEHNFSLLGIKGYKVVCGYAEDYLQRQMGQVDFIYLDPARRDAAGHRTYGIADCTPDVAALAPQLLSHSRCVMVKLSPMLDWHEAVAQLSSVAEVHIVAAGNECKELLVVMIGGFNGSPRLFCCNDGENFEIIDGPQCQSVEHIGPESARYLYEPNAALMKSGAFGFISSHFGVSPVSSNSHLFLSAAPVKVFPGRCFEIKAVSTMNKRDLRQSLDGLRQANVAVRNFPMTVNQLRQKLRLADGGDTYIFATTTGDNRHLLLICQKLPHAEA